MKYYLKDIFPKLKKYSASLDQSSFLVDKPWVVTNSPEKFEKLIFKSNGTLYLSSNGDVTEGKWEYLPEAQSLLIDYGDRKKLYRHQYLDEAVLALKLDGPQVNDDDYFLLANENVVQNYDAVGYLKSKLKANKLIDEDDHSKKLIQDIQLSGGLLASIIKSSNSAYNKLYIDGELANNGEYLSSDKNELFEIENGKIINSYKRSAHGDITIWKSASRINMRDKIEGMDRGEITIEDKNERFRLIIEKGKIKDFTNLTEKKYLLILTSTIIAVFFIILVMIFIYESM